MAGFCVIEGVDGAGKTHLLRTLARHLEKRGRHPFTMISKDQFFMGSGSWGLERLTSMCRLTWPSDVKDPIWDYPHQYWLHMLSAWFILLHHQIIAPALTNNKIVVTDGWYYKQLARLSLICDDQEMDYVRATFSRLPQADLIIDLQTPTRHILERKHDITPVEQGALENPSNAIGIDGSKFIAYQNRVRRALDALLHEHPNVLSLEGSDSVETGELLDLIYTQVN